MIRLEQGKQDSYKFPISAFSSSIASFDQSTFIAEFISFYYEAPLVSVLVAALLILMLSMQFELLSFCLVGTLDLENHFEKA